MEDYRVGDILIFIGDNSNSSTFKKGQKYTIREIIDGTFDDSDYGSDFIIYFKDSSYGCWGYYAKIFFKTIADERDKMLIKLLEDGTKGTD
jgi:hypothetical protein